MPQLKGKTHKHTSDDIELARYHRRLKLAAKFYGQERDEQEGTIFREPSTWEPNPAELPPPLWDLIAADREILKAKPYLTRADQDNITEAEWKALQKLSRDTSVVIKPADKGSNVVIMDRPAYIKEAMRQLNNEDDYKRLEAPIYLESIPMFRDILQKLQQGGYLRKGELEFLSGSDIPRPRHIYFLPKIHKKKSAWPVPDRMPPGRPICSDCNSESYHIASFLEHHLHPLSTLHPSYIKDTPDLLAKLKNIHLSEGDILISMDVTGLYTHIETGLGLSAVDKAFQRHPDPKRPDKLLLDLLELSLTRHDFRFDDQWFLQIRGTAMGKRFAPSYANIYMAEWEETVLLKYPKRPSHYFRFLDDMWAVWPHSLEELHEWLQVLNSHHPSIKLTMTFSPLTVDFLDITIFKGPDFHTTGILDTKVFFKPTDSHALLHHTSFHPPHTFKGIVKSQLIRFDRICSRPEDREEAIQVLFTALRQRGYTRQFLRTVRRSWEDDKKRREEKERDTREGIGSQTIEEGEAPPGKIIPIISLYSEHSSTLHRQLMTNLQRAQPDLPFTQEIRVVSAFKRNKNLTDFLVHSKLPGIKPQRIHPSRTWRLKNPSTGETVALPKGLPPSTENVVYCLKCRVCGKLYVGETGSSLTQRLSSHRYAISTGRNLSHLGLHFSNHGVDQMNPRILAHNSNWSTEARRRQEQLWIQRLDSRHPKGLNTTVFQPVNGSNPEND